MSKALYIGGGIAIGAIIGSMMSKGKEKSGEVLHSASVMSSWCDPTGMGQKDAQALLPHIKQLRPSFQKLAKEKGGPTASDVEGALFNFDVIERIAKGELVAPPPSGTVPQ